MRRLLPALLAAGAACSPSPGPAPFGGQAPSTCYALEYAGEGAAVFPVRIGFVGTRGWTVGVPSPEGRRVWQMFRYGGSMGPVPGDSSEVRFSNGFSAVMLRLQAHGDSLFGGAWFASDVVSPEPPPRTPVRGHRIDCDPNERW